MEFEWDPKKAARNFKQHRVSFQEAMEAFSDARAIDEFDGAHSSDEEHRFALIGVSSTRLLFVNYTIRDETTIRIISARKAIKHKSGFTKMPKTKEKGFVYEMTQEEYDEGLAKGWAADDMLSVGKHTFRRSQWAEKLKNAKKVKVSIYLDGDVVEHFRLRAEQPNAAPYQTQINNELRKVLENGSTNSASVERAILNDKKFLKALKKKLETV